MQFAEFQNLVCYVENCSREVESWVIIFNLITFSRLTSIVNKLLNAKKMCFSRNMILSLHLTVFANSLTGTFWNYEVSQNIHSKYTFIIIIINMIMHTVQDVVADRFLVTPSSALTRSFLLCQDENDYDYENDDTWWQW